MSGAQAQDIELENQNRDVERVAPPERRLTWYNNLVSASAPNGASVSSASARTSNSTWTDVTLNLLMKWPSRKSDATITAIQEESAISESRDAFVFAITKTAVRSDILEPACKWYTSFLECRIRESWVTLFQRVLVDIDTNAATPCDEDLSVAFQLLAAVVLAFERKELALMEIVDELHNKKFLRYTDEDRSDALQLVFAAFGWISVLYCPSPNPEKGYLQILNLMETDQQSPGDVRERYPRSRSRTFTSYQQSLESYDQPLHVFLKRFGKIMPRATVSRRYEGWIEVSSVCFSRLHKFASIKIEWVDCLSMHLEFDRRSKVLKIFRFPSLCLVMCCSKDSLLSQLFLDSVDSVTSEDGVRPEVIDASEYFKEVLLSYRLIFGEDKTSHHSFSRMRPKWHDKWYGTEALKREADSLLLTLCGQSWHAEGPQAIYDAIGAEYPSPRYSSTIDFPFLGKRLLELQSYVKDHNPKTLIELWHNKRDVTWWWTFWVGLAVIIIAIATLLLAIFQVVLQIIQVVIAEKQLNQHQGLKV